MGTAEILDVNVIPNATAVSGFVVAPIDRDMRAAPRCNLQDQGDEVGFGLMALAKLSFRIPAGGVKLAQAHGLQTVSDIIIPSHLLDHPLAAAIQIGRATV